MSQGAAIGGIAGFVIGFAIIGAMMLWRHAVCPSWHWMRKTWPDKPKKWQQGKGPPHP